jgi:hypothetical protein
MCYFEFNIVHKIFRLIVCIAEHLFNQGFSFISSLDNLIKALKVRRNIKDTKLAGEEKYIFSHSS